MHAYHFTIDLVLLCTQLKTAATVCRASKGQCDLPEFCSGIDLLCPSDVYKRNTEKCSVDKVKQIIIYCFLLLPTHFSSKPSREKDTSSLTKKADLRGQNFGKNDATAKRSIML